MNPNERSCHPSLAQIETLLEVLERNPSLAKGYTKCASARDAARKQWERLAVSLNSMGGSIKSWKQWNKYWADKKSAVKRKAALRGAARRRTGGGVEQVVELTQLEERMVTLMGGENFAVGDQHLAIHPFDDELQQNTTHHDTSSLPHSSSIVHAECVPGTSFPSESSSYVIELPAQASLPSSPRNSPASATMRVSSTNLQSQSSQQPRHITTPRRLRRRQLTPLSPPAQRRSQLTSITNRFLHIEEQRLQIDRRHTELLEQVVSIVSSQMESESARSNALIEALTSNSKALEMLAQSLNNK